MRAAISSAAGRAAKLLSLLRGQSGVAAVAQTGLATLLVLTINTATGILAARFLGARGRGELSALLLGPQLLSFLFTLGLPIALIVKVKSRPDDASGLLGAALTLSLPMGAAAAAAGFAAAPFVLGRYDAHVIHLARILLAFVFSGVPSTVMIAALQLRNRFDAYNRIRYGQSALVLLALLGLAAAGENEAFPWALAYLFAPVPFFVWNLRWVFREFKPRLIGLRPQMRGLLSYGLPVHGVDAAGTLLGQIDKLILVGALSPAAFGIYVVVFNLSRLITTFAGAVVPVLVARTAGKRAEDIRTTTARALSATLLLSLGALGAFIFCGSFALRWLYGMEFARGYWTLVILGVEAVTASGASILQQPYLVTGRAGFVAAFQVASLGVGAAAILLLVRLGTEGAALGLLAATAGRLALVYGGYSFVLRMKAPRLVPAWSDCVMLVASLRPGATA